MSKKEEKLIKAACEVVGLNSDVDFKKIEDVKIFRDKIKEGIEYTIVTEQEAIEHREKLQGYLNAIEQLLQQIDIEEYKLLNPHAKDIFYP